MKTKSKKKVDTKRRKPTAGRGAPAVNQAARRSLPTLAKVLKYLDDELSEAQTAERVAISRGQECAEQVASARWSALYDVYAFIKLYRKAPEGNTTSQP